jgi:TetR/AcrR family transcriptional regulator
LPIKLYEKESVLDSCFIMFSKYGYRNTTTAMLAEKAGISKALLFHHFKSKKQIYLSVLERIFDKMSLEVVDEPLTEYKDYFEARANSGHNKISYLRSNPEANKILLEAFQFTPHELRADIKRFSLRIKEKYGDKDEKKELLMKKLFSELKLREGVDREQAYELVGIVTQHFRKKVAIDLTDEEKLYDEKYWKDFFDKRKKFLSMIRYGIQIKDKE